MQVDVTALGTLAVDYFAIVPKLIGAEEKIISEGYELFPGGVAGNVLTQIARLGVSAGWFGMIGDDEPGEILVREFQKEGVDCSHVEKVAGEHTMITWIQVDRRGERSIVMFPNVLNKLTERDVEEKHGDYIRQSKVMHAEACLLPLRPVLRAMEIAKQAGVKIVFDLDVPPTSFVKEMGLATMEELMRALELTDVLIPCKSAAAELLKSDDIVGNAPKLLELGPATVAVTLGERGCMVLDREQYHTVPAFQVNVVDTTGAGDAFHGGFIYSVLREMDLLSAAIFANACGALCCTRLGARAMGSLEDINALVSRGQRI
jgi:sugar/nucleoside kinase (ribokinase family)